MFQGHSLALAAAIILPGPNKLQFLNFDVTAEIVADIKDNMMNDLFKILGTEDDDEEELKIVALGLLELARKRLDRLQPDVDPLKWWPAQDDLGMLFPLVKMLLVAPASSADSERSFSSASFTLDIKISRMDVETFRREHRLRRFLVAGTSLQTREGRQQRLD